MTPELFNELPHIDVHVVLGQPGTGHRVAQRGWERAHVRRRVVLTVPYFFIAAMAAAETDCVAALPSRMADLCVRLLPLKRSGDVSTPAHEHRDGLAPANQRGPRRETLSGHRA